MAILINENTKVICQGITGEQGAFHTKHCLEYGTKIVGGVTPGKGGTINPDGLPIFDSVHEAVLKTGANTTMIYVPAAFVHDAILEAINAGLKLIVCITDGVPALDMMKIRALLDSKKDIIFIGPNCPGIINPGAKCKIGIMPGYIHSGDKNKKKIGIVSRSGTLTYEAVAQTTENEFSQSTCIGIGGDPIHGIGFTEVVKMFLDDEETDAILLIGEIGGDEEERAAEFAKNYHIKKPMIGFIAGVSAPAGRRMGHAGAIVSGGKGDALSKIKFLKECGFNIAETPSSIGITVSNAFKKYS